MNNDIKPTFTTSRILLLIVIGPLTAALTAIALYFGPHGWMFHTDWSTGHPLVNVGQVPNHSPLVTDDGVPPATP